MYRADKERKQEARQLTVVEPVKGSTIPPFSRRSSLYPCFVRAERSSTGV